jgi:TnpA family transposase
MNEVPKALTTHILPIEKEKYMPGKFLTDAQRYGLTHFPTDISHEDISAYFTLTEDDKLLVRKQHGPHNRLGVALQIGILRYLGFFPDDLVTIPASVVNYVAAQLGLSSQELLNYGRRGQTRTDHIRHIEDYLRFQGASEAVLKELSEWLVQRALEHDKPILLFQMASEKLYSMRIIRPGVTTLERLVIAARQLAQEETYQRLSSLITNDHQRLLDSILIPGETAEQPWPRGQTALHWLSYAATANTPEAILETIDKLLFLKELGVEQWDLSPLNPNRQKFLAQVGRRSTNQAFQRMSSQRRYPILIAFLHQSLQDITDELIDLFDRCLSDRYKNAKRDNQAFRIAIATTTNEKLMLFQDIARIVLDPAIPDERLRDMIYQKVPEDKLQTSLEECATLIRPADDMSYDYFVKRYHYLRTFAPRFLTILHFASNQSCQSLLEALEQLKKLNATGKRKIPEDAPLAFVPKSWLPYVLDDKGEINRRYYETCVLWELRNALRSGDVWVRNSRRYANPETYLIPKIQWQQMRSEACRLLGLPQHGEDRLQQRQRELEEGLFQLDRELSRDDSYIRIENDKLVLSPLEAETLPESSKKLQKLITERLPRLDLTELLIEVDGWTHFTDCFKHAGGSQPRTRDLLVHLYASILAQACNFGLVKMAEVSSLTYDRLAWCTHWYLRDETLKTGIDTLVNFQYHQPLSRLWGGGTMSSSDGQRFPVPVKSQNAVSLPRYFGYGKGLTFMSWTSNQYSQYGSKVVPSTNREATYVLDAILDNETELEIMEHTTDTAGYTELVYALFDLLGMRFSPRIRDIGDQTLYRMDRSIRYPHLKSILKQTINQKRILEDWDDLLRAASSVKLGWVTASLLISKLQASKRKNALAKGLQEYGRVIKSIDIPYYLCHQEHRRRVGIQLNKGEEIHNLRQFLLFANEGKIRKSHIEDQSNQAGALTLVTNAVIVWNTRYIQAVVDQLQKEGFTVDENDLIHVSPCRFEHINKYGKYHFNVDIERNRKELRSLRLPENP